MQNTQKLDFIVVYSNKNAHSAANKKYIEESPFSKRGSYTDCTAAYAYLLSYAKRLGLRAGFATVEDICGVGEFSSYWVYRNTHWQRVAKKARTTVVFDKFESTLKSNMKTTSLLVGKTKKIRLYHNTNIRKLFDNKISTYATLSEYMLPTVAINMGSEKTMRTARTALKKQTDAHKHIQDFTGDLILKDIFGGGGNHVYKIRTDAGFTKIAASAQNVQFLLQPFIHASDFNTQRKNGLADLRVIISSGTMLQSYIRTAKKGDFRSNAKQGGHVDYITIDRIPKNVVEMIAKIQKTTDLQNALYTLDFMQSKNGNLYLVEGNASPGLTWSNTEDERRTKQLIRLIVKHLQMMAQ